MKGAMVERTLWSMDVGKILKICTSSRQRQDFFAWYLEKNDRFSVKSAHHFATDEHDEQFAGGLSSANPDGNRSIWNLIWLPSIPLRMKHMAWRAATGALPTTTCMQYRHLTTCSTCPICGTVDEDNYHALIACNHACTIWEAGMSGRFPRISFSLTVGKNGYWTCFLIALLLSETKLLCLFSTKHPYSDTSTAIQARQF